MAWVYVFRNIDQRFAGLYKIGHTTRVDPETRAREISTRTGVIGKYIVEGVYEVDSSDTVEREVHRLLRAKRYQNNREFFRASLAEIDAAIHEAVENVGDYLYDGTQPVVTEEEREEEEHRRDCRKREAERKSQERMAEAEQRAQKLKAEAAAQEAQQ
jgi:hypothetical protein